MLCSKVQVKVVRDLALFHTAAACVEHAQAAAEQRYGFKYLNASWS